MTFNPLSGEYDQGALATMMEHIEQPMRTLVALRQITSEAHEDGVALAIIALAAEDALDDLVTSALALITSSWAVAAGHDLLENEDDPAVDAWATNILTAAMALAHNRYHELIVDYEAKVGPMPSQKGASDV